MPPCVLLHSKKLLDNLRNNHEELCLLLENVDEFDFDKFKALVNADPNVLNLWHEGRVIACLSCEYGYIEVVKWLVNVCKIDVNTGFIDGVDIDVHSGLRAKVQARPLSEAIINDHYELVDFLLAQDAIAVDNCEGFGALHAASEKGNVQLVNNLLDKGALTHLTALDGHTALMIAANGGHAEVVEKLISVGACTHAVSNDASTNPRMTALMMAKKEKHTGVVRVLTDAGAVDDYRPSVFNISLVCCAGVVAGVSAIYMNSLG